MADSNRILRFFGGAAVAGPLGRNNGSIPNASFLSGADAYRAKVDDGKPGTGYVVSPAYMATSGRGRS